MTNLNGPRVVNYSVSIGLGFVGTVEANVNHGSLLQGYRSGMYIGLGRVLGALLEYLIHLSACQSMSSALTEDTERISRSLTLRTTYSVYNCRCLNRLSKILPSKTQHVTKLYRFQAFVEAFYSARNDLQS